MAKITSPWGTAIKGFKGEYRWLSNFWPSPLFFNGFDFPMVEHAYVAHKVEPAKYVTTVGRIIEMTPGQVKRFGRTITLRADWEEIKLPLMQALQMRKYNANPELKAKLVATGDCYIEETNTWGDTYWGVCHGQGENHLGRILMGLREYYAKHESVPNGENATCSGRTG